MAYLINKSDGSVLTTVSDGQIDNLTTDLTLIGKNYSGFGEAFNENLVKLLENFASSSRPTKPVRGQIWFDVTELKLKVYNGTAFQPVSSATISATVSHLGVISVFPTIFGLLALNLLFIMFKKRNRYL
jgi:hypothetical protein